MRRNDDAYGRMMWDFHRGIPAREIVERDDGFISAGKSARLLRGPFQRVAASAAEVDEPCVGARTRYRLRAGDGTPSTLQQEGFDVLGIDSLAPGHQEWPANAGPQEGQAW